MEMSEQIKRDEETSDAAYRKMMEQINKTLMEKYPNALKITQEGQVVIVELQQLERIMNDNNITNNNQSFAPTKGRGGNNVAENMKKSVLSIMKKRLSSSLYQEYEQRYIKPYQLKSQKENFVLFFLFLHQFLFQRKINHLTLELIQAEIMARVKKYVKNSEIRKDQEPQRREFHQKNLTQFRKYMEIDLDFSRPRSYLQVREWIRGQYLKKKAVFYEAERKVRKIFEKHPAISKIFVDLQASKSQKLSPNQQGSSESNYAIKLEQFQSS